MQSENQLVTSILMLIDLRKPQSIQLAQIAIDLLIENSQFVVYSQDIHKLSKTNLYTQQVKKQIKYIISIGSNHTMMRAHRFFHDKSVPIVSISDGEEPILSSFSSCQMINVIQKFVKAVQEDNMRIMETLQFEVCQKNNQKQVIGQKIAKSNFSFQLEIHRDMSKSVLKLKIYARIQGKNFFRLANVWGDGIIISTPLGSLGRNLSLSGPIVYKSLQSITIVPICPLSLNFRPIILPATSEIVIQIDQESRSSGLVYADNEMVEPALAPGKQIYLKKSAITTKIVKGLGEKSTEQQWISCLRDVLSWGQAYNSDPKIHFSASNVSGSKL